jgi:hypothetical protein
MLDISFNFISIEGKPEGQRAMSIGEHITGPISYLMTRASRRDRTNTVLKVSFLSLQMIDLLLTAIAARYGWSELNPFMQSSFDSLYKLAIFKFVIPVLISWFVPGRLLIPAIILLCGILGWNIKEMLCLAF